MTPPRIIPVTPLRWEKHFAFVNPGGAQMVDTPIYPEHPRGETLRSLRMACDIYMRDAGRLVGITAEQLSGLEHGRYTLENDTVWCELFAALAAEYERREDVRRAAIGGGR